jgi:hypothetical protein
MSTRAVLAELVAQATYAAVYERLRDAGIGPCASGVEAKAYADATYAAAQHVSNRNRAISRIREAGAN